MHLISSLLFAISANIDSFILGMSYGIKKSNINLLKSTIISLVTLIGTVLAILMGTEISQLLSPTSTRAIGCTLLICLGLYYIIKSIWGYIKEKYRKSEVKTNEVHCSTYQESAAKGSLLTLTLKEGLLLGLALSINNFGMGIGASMTGLLLFPTALISLVVSVIFLYGGNFIGKTKMPHMTDQTADIISGLILVGLAVYEMLI